MAGNFNDSTREMIGNMALGLRVDRAAAALAAATTPFFTVTGQIQVMALYAVVTVASDANACSWSVNPTDGTTVKICGDLDINPAIAGDILGITGVLATAMTYGGAVVGIMQPLIITAGTIDFIAAAADGTISAHIIYIPLSTGANVVTA
jgi:hypothetical protein